jgi:hypothetical protein
VSVVLLVLLLIADVVGAGSLLVPVVEAGKVVLLLVGRGKGRVVKGIRVRERRLVVVVVVVVVVGARSLRVRHVVDAVERAVAQLLIVLVLLVRVECDAPRNLLLTAEATASIVIGLIEVGEDAKLAEDVDELGRAQFELLPDLLGPEVGRVERVERCGRKRGQRVVG